MFYEVTMQEGAYRNMNSTQRLVLADTNPEEIIRSVKRYSRKEIRALGSNVLALIDGSVDDLSSCGTHASSNALFGVDDELVSPAIRRPVACRCICTCV